MEWLALMNRDCTSLKYTASGTDCMKVSMIRRSRRRSASVARRSRVMRPARAMARECAVMSSQVSTAASRLIATPPPKTAASISRLTVAPNSGRDEIHSNHWRP